MINNKKYGLEFIITSPSNYNLKGKNIKIIEREQIL